jgi:oligosaccharide repeat unit polymerase
MHLIWLILGLGLCTGIIASVITYGVEKTIVWVAGVAAMLLLFLPSILRSYDVFQPLSFITLTITIGVALRSIYIITFDDEHVSNGLLLGKSSSFVFEAHILILLSLFTLLIGYVIKFPKIRISQFSLIRNDCWNTRRLMSIVFLFIIIAAVGTAIFIKEMGIEFVVLSNISEKHSYIVEGAVHEKASLGYVRWAAELVAPAFYMLLTWFAASSRKLLSFSGAGVIFIGLLASIFPILTSTRTGVAVVLIIALVIWHYMRKPMYIHTMVWTMVIGIFVLMVMSALRKGANSSSEVGSYLTGGKIFESLVGNRNFLGIDKTALIIDAVPKKLPYRYGSTFLLWLAAPIPRTLWLEKPVISAGDIIGDELYLGQYGVVTGGVPPGIIGELYWNFGLVGVLGGMFLLGCFLNILYQSFRMYLWTNKNALMVYIPFLTTFAFNIPSSNFSSSIVDSLITGIIPIIFALWYIGTRPKIPVVQRT